MKVDRDALEAARVDRAVAARCSERIWQSFHPQPCSRRGVLTEDGRPWCRQHAPSTVAARRREMEQRVDARLKQIDREVTRRKAERDLMELIRSIPAADRPVGANLIVNVWEAFE